LPNHLKHWQAVQSTTEVQNQTEINQLLFGKQQKSEKTKWLGTTLKTEICHQTCAESSQLFV